MTAGAWLHDIHRSTYYRLKGIVDRFGREILRPRVRRSPQMLNSIAELIERRIIGSLGSRPARITSEPACENNGGSPGCSAGVARVLKRHGIHTHALRNGPLAACAAPPELARDPKPRRAFLLASDALPGVPRLGCPISE